MFVPWPSIAFYLAGSLPRSHARALLRQTKRRRLVQCKGSSLE